MDPTTTAVTREMLAVLNGNDIGELCAQEVLPLHYVDDFARHGIPLAAALATQCLNGAIGLVGLNGCQGSGKTTLARFLSLIMERGAGLSCTVLSLDDFYLGRDARATLARDRHPLFRTRGVPGTHDVALVEATLDALQRQLPSPRPLSAPERSSRGTQAAVKDSRRDSRPSPAARGVPESFSPATPTPDDAEPRSGRAGAGCTGNELPEPVAIPRFDKAIDERLARERWPIVTSRPDIVILEGWCVGCPPQPEDALTTAVNELERNEDSDRHWRRYVNRRLAGDYRQLFARLDRLVMLAAPGFDRVLGWRRQQERQLARRLGVRAESASLMDDQALRRFVSHYERLTRYQLQVLPAQADAIIELSPTHRLVAHRGPLFV